MIVVGRTNAVLPKYIERGGHLWYNNMPLSPERTAIMASRVNLQDLFLNQARKAGVPVTVFLMNGFQLRGFVTGFDSFVVVLVSDGKQQMIYKHAISTLAPMKPLKAAATTA